MRHVHNTVATLGSVILMLGLAACGGGGDPEGGGSQSISPTPTIEASPSKPSSASDAWKKGYSTMQLKAYDAALARWEEYEDRSEPIWSRGKATEAAADLFKEYFPSPFWQNQYKTLSSYEQSEVKIEGTAGIYWSKAQIVAKNGLSVKVDQCVDYRQITVTQHGKDPEGEVAWLRKPQLRTISMAKPKGYDWLIYGVVNETNTKESRPCKP